MVGLIMNLISGVHHSCERRKHAFMVIQKYTIISLDTVRQHADSQNICILHINKKTDMKLNPIPPIRD